MMGKITLGVDYAAPHTREQVRCLRNKGVSFVVRYLTIPSLNWKRLTKAEAQMLAEEGMGIVSVYQVRNTMPEDFTRDKAERDAKAALDNAREVGQPLGTPIYFAVDFNAPYGAGDMELIRAYFRRVKDLVEAPGYYRVGVYGSYSVVEVLADAVDSRWQTYAWSGGKVSDKAHMLQFRNGANWCSGGNDLNIAWGNPGWWPTPPANPKFPGMPDLKRGDSRWEVAVLQALLSRLNIEAGPTDGIFGPKTEAAVLQFNPYSKGVMTAPDWEALIRAQAPVEDVDWQTLALRYEVQLKELKKTLEDLAGGIRV